MPWYKSLSYLGFCNFLMKKVSVPITEIGVAKGQGGTYISIMTTEEKQLVTMYAVQVFHGTTVRQDYPVCECGKMFSEKELYNAPAVYFKKVDIFGKTYTLIEPVCPICKQKIPASFNVLN